MTKKAIKWTVVGTLCGLIVVGLCVGLGLLLSAGYSALGTTATILTPFSPVTKEDAQNIISSIPKNNQSLKKVVIKPTIKRLTYLKLITIKMFIVFN